MKTVKPIGQHLIEQGRLSVSDLEKALRFQAEFGGRLGAVLVRLGICSEDTLLPVLADQLGIALARTEIMPEPGAVKAALEQLPYPPAWFHERGVLVWQDSAGGNLHAASRQARDGLLDELIEELALTPLVWHLLPSEAEVAWLEMLQPARLRDGVNDVGHLRELAEEAPTIALVNNVFTQAVEAGASDIHIEPELSNFRVRLRIDGILVERLRASRNRLEAVVSRVKLMSNLDIAERRLPQDGRISITAAGVALDVRVSTLPGPEGESVVMRLLRKESSHIDLTTLGLSPDLFLAFSEMANQPHGLVLVAGPTGSGKSTTLYALLNAMNTGERKIITIEDPVEYRIKGVIQIQAHADIGYSFSRALRAILRQDPDVIMIGEIRDPETAQIAVQSSLTGHAVLSTLHTNDALSTFSRLTDMGVEPYLLASAVCGALAQRLVRRVCRHCAESTTMPQGLKTIYDVLIRRFPELMACPPGFIRVKGCEHCLGTGYSGRVGIYEWVAVTQEISHAIVTRVSVSLPALGDSYRSLQEDGLIKAWQGETTLDEVFRVTGEAAEQAVVSS